MEKKGRANGTSGNVGVAACMIVEGKGGVGNVPIRAKIVATSARGRTVVPGEIVERGGNNVQGCPSQRKCKKKIMYDVLTCIPNIHYSNSCINHNPKVVSARISGQKHNKLPLSRRGESSGAVSRVTRFNKELAVYFRG